jgi:hypothetical protein
MIIVQRGCHELIPHNILVVESSGWFHMQGRNLWAAQIGDTGNALTGCHALFSISHSSLSQLQSTGLNHTFMHLCKVRISMLLLALLGLEGSQFEICGAGICMEFCLR